MSPRVIGGLAVGHEIWFGWLERILSPFCKTLKGINHTKANDASVIFQRNTLPLVSQATSKVRKCLLNLEVHVHGTNTRLSGESQTSCARLARVRIVVAM